MTSDRIIRKSAGDAVTDVRPTSRCGLDRQAIGPALIAWPPEPQSRH
jgi:hypothetical protein